MNRVQLEFPNIEVRFKGLKVDAYVHVGSRALPTIPNFIFNMTEVILSIPFFKCNLSFLLCSVNPDKNHLLFQGFFEAFENIPWKKNETTNFG